jgi:ribosome biogenesis GTPase
MSTPVFTSSSAIEGDGLLFYIGHMEAAALKAYGLDDFFLSRAKVFADHGWSLGRVVREHRESFLVRTAAAEVPAEVSGRLRFTASGRVDFPAVGDWVMVDVQGEPSAGIIHEILPRRTMLVRKSAGRSSEAQVIATNVDLVFIIQGLDGNFNSRRLERFLVVVHESGAEPVVLLSKADLYPPAEVAALLADALSAAGGARVIAYSAVTGAGLHAVRALVAAGRTVCFIGSSGVGKSTLINALHGAELLPTGAVRPTDDRGRHTTARREMLVLPSGGVLIDTPGMREVGLWQMPSALDDAFPEIAVLAEDCRFRDCTHRHEPGCAVRRALEEERLDPARYESYATLRKEGEVMEERSELNGRLRRKRRERILSKAARQVLRTKGKK